MLSFFAAKPGVLTIKAICNSMHCCERNLGMEGVVHAIPKATVGGGMFCYLFNHFLGTDIIEDIREGLEIIYFRG